MPNNKFQQTQAAFTLTLLAFLSPMAGFFVELVLAWQFGTSGIVDAFRTAAVFLIWGNQWFGPQFLSHILVPLISEYRAQEREKDSLHLGISLASLFGTLALFFLAFVHFFPIHVLNLIAPGISGENLESAVQLIKWFSFVFVVIVWVGVINGLLYVYRIFWTLPVSQAFSNVCLIISILVLGKFYPSISLGLGVFIGGIAAFLLHLMMLYRIIKSLNLSYLDLIKLGPIDGIKKALALSFPLFLTTIIVQWSGVIINRTLTLISEGSLAQFGYAWKPLILITIFSSSILTVVFPSLSEAFACRDLEKFSRICKKSLNMVCFLNISLAMWMYFLRFTLVSVLFERGAMSKSSIVQISEIYGVLLIGVTLANIINVLYKIFYSIQDMKSTALLSLASAIFITFAVPYSSKVGGSIGVAWAINANYIVNVLFSWLRLSNKIGRKDFFISASTFLKTLLFALVFSLPAIIGTSFFREIETYGLLEKLLYLLVCGCLSLATIPIFRKFITFHELEEICSFVSWKFKNTFLIKHSNDK